MTNSARELAISAFSIQDVFLIESRHTLIRSHNPQESLVSVNFQLRHHVESDVILQTRREPSGKEVLILRCFVNAGFRALHGEAKSEANIEENKLAEIEGVFAADYVVNSGEPPAEELIVAFRDNIVFHVWPYWRELVQSTLARSRLPSIAIPMFRVRQKPPLEQQSQAPLPERI